MADILYNIIIIPIIQILEFSFALSEKLFRNTGISVIFISLTISILCLPLYVVAEKWQQLEREIAKKSKSKIDKIKAVFKGDERYMLLSTYYRQINYHPIYALRSSFGLLIQIPFFIAAYTYLSHLELLKNVPFYFIKDLSSPDAFFTFGGITVNILPFIMTLINCLSSAIYTKNLSAKDKIQLYGMAGIFLILLYNSPAALVLYWTMNNIFSLLKNIYYMLRIKHKHFILLLLFSICCILMAIIVVVKYYRLLRGEKLVYFCIFSAFFPWVFVVFKNKLSLIFNTTYEKRESLSLFLLSAFLVFVLLGLFIPSQLIVSSPQEFSFIDEYTNPTFFIFIAALQVFGLFVLWPVCLYFLFSDNIKKYFYIIFFAISTAMLVNVFLFSGNYGLISINFIYEDGVKHAGSEIILNLIVMLIIMVLSFFLCKLKNKKIITIFLSSCIFSLLSISIYNIYKSSNAFNELKTYYVKEQEMPQEISPVFSLSQDGKNIVIIMLDRAISVFIPFIFEESPELWESYSGFSYYPNTVSFSGFTAIGSVPIFGGYDYTPEEINKKTNITLVEKHNQALLMLPCILNENNFSVCVTDLPYANYNWRSDLSIFDDLPVVNVTGEGGGVKAIITVSKYTNLWLKENNLNLPKTGDVIKRNMFWYSFMKGLPLFFREPIYMIGNWCSPIPNRTLLLTLNNYSVLDFLPRLTEIAADNKNNALIMTNNLPHEPSLLQAPDYVPAITISNYGDSRFSKDNMYHATAASIKRLSDWFEFLKNNNVYDNTKIILVSDHGPRQNYVTKIGLPFNVDQFNPLLMVKDFNASGVMQTDMSFMSNADVPYLSLNNVIENPTNPFTGNSISMEPKNLPLYIAISGSNNIPGRNATQFPLDPDLDYYVHDNIFIYENWVKVNR